MSIIDNKYIHKKSALATTYDRGLQLYNKNKIVSIQETKVGEYNIEFSAECIGSNKKKYNPIIEITAEYNKIQPADYMCECPAFASYGGFCKHLVATALAINDNFDEESITAFLNDGQIGTVNSENFSDNIEDYNKSEMEAYIQEVFNGVADKLYSNNVITSSGRTFTQNERMVSRSSSVLLSAITDFSEREREKYCISSPILGIRLEPIFHFDNNKLFVEFRIGKDKMYVVKNIEMLVFNIVNKKYGKYGKQLELVHSKEVFAEMYHPVIEYLINYNFAANNLYRSSYTSNSDKRYINFENNVVDDFIKIYAGQYVEAYVENEYYKIDLYIAEDNPKLPIKIKGINNEEKVEVSFPKAQVVFGKNTAFVVYNDILYCCSRKFYEKTNSILDIIKNVNTKEIYRGYYNFEEKEKKYELYKRDYGAFLDTIYPVMKKYMQLSAEDIDFSKYENEEGKYEVYFDLNEAGDVTCLAKATYGNNVHFLTVLPDAKETYRDFKTEYELRNSIEKYFPKKTTNSKLYILSKGDDERLADLVEEGIKEIEQIAQIYLSDEFSKIKITRISKISTGLSIKGNLLNVSWNVEGMSGNELNEILDSYRRKKKYHRLKSGELLNLNGIGLDVLKDLQDDFHISKTQMKSGNVELPMYRALYLDYLMKENSSKIYLSKDESFKKIIDDFENIKKTDFKLPEEINADLRNYQLDGYKWACMLSKLGFGGVLADDMGLGKTLQMISFMCSEKSGTHMVICPASLVYNWESEFEKFAPAMKVVAVVGNVNERKLIIDDYKNYDVLITSYDLLKRDIDEYTYKEFNCEVIDEAQYIKNPSTLAAKAVKSIKSNVRFALTGTPIENRLSELWSIFEYLMPGYLFSYKAFKERFEERIITPSKLEDEENALNHLRNMIAPFLLRRLKKDVLKDLPDKIEEVIYAKFDEKQKKLYQATEKNLLMSIKKSSKQQVKENKMQILAEITKLRQICCDPSLLIENYNSESAKLEAGAELIESAVLSGHKILLFSQFTSMLEIIKERLEEKQIKYNILTGATSKKKRRELVEDFQEGNADVFLISLKAGGTGLNLTAADVVIHYDPWWNVAAQNQATDRAHRIGQQNKVTVIKLIVKDTIEERILKLQDKKRELADKIISEESASISAFTKEELLELFEE